MSCRVWFRFHYARQETTEEEEALEGKGGAAAATEGDRSAAAAAFPLDRHIKVAVKMLSLDPNLAKVHARLISHMPEKTFWYHYFSRVAILRAEVNLEPLCEDLSQVEWGGGENNPTPQMEGHCFGVGHRSFVFLFRGPPHTPRSQQ